MENLSPRTLIRNIVKYNETARPVRKKRRRSSVSSSALRRQAITNTVNQSNMPANTPRTTIQNILKYDDDHTPAILKKARVQVGEKRKEIPSLVASPTVEDDDEDDVPSPFVIPSEVDKSKSRFKTSLTVPDKAFPKPINSTSDSGSDKADFVLGSSDTGSPKSDVEERANVVSRPETEKSESGSDSGGLDNENDERVITMSSFSAAYTETTTGASTVSAKPSPASVSDDTGGDLKEVRYTPVSNLTRQKEHILRDANVTHPDKTAVADRTLDKSKNIDSNDLVDGELIAAKSLRDNFSIEESSSKDTPSKSNIRIATPKSFSASRQGTPKSQVRLSRSNPETPKSLIKSQVTAHQVTPESQNKTKNTPRSRTKDNSNQSRVSNSETIASSRRSREASPKSSSINVSRPLTPSSVSRHALHSPAEASVGRLGIASFNSHSKSVSKSRTSTLPRTRMVSESISASQQVLPGVISRKSTSKSVVDPEPEDDSLEVSDISDASDVENVSTNTQKDNLKKKATQKRQPRTRKPVRKDILPRSITKSIFTHFAKSRVPNEALDAVDEICDKYWSQTVDILDRYSSHAKRQTIKEDDFELMFRRQGLVTDNKSLHTLVEEYLPLEAQIKIIPCAKAGNKIVPKIKKKVRRRRSKHDDDDDE